MHCGWSNFCLLVRMQAIHIGHGSVHVHVEHASANKFLANIKKQWTCFEQINHDNDPGTRFLKQTQWHRVHELCFSSSKLHAQISSIHNAPKIAQPHCQSHSVCLIDIRRRNRPQNHKIKLTSKTGHFLKLTENAQSMMQTVFGHPPG